MKKSPNDPPDPLPRPVDPDTGPTPIPLPDDPGKDAIIQPVAPGSLDT